MKSVIPFVKEIEFKTKLAEISSISLEHEYQVSEGALVGSFIITGEYKVHEISVNKDKFLEKLPFRVELPSTIEINTVSVNINDFTYEVLEEKCLKVNIEFTLEADEVLEREEEVGEQPYDEIASLIEQIEEVEESLERETPLIVNEENAEVIKNQEDTYVLYNIHIVKDGDTLELIAEKYMCSTEVITEYNGSEPLKTGDKIIIPKSDE